MVDEGCKAVVMEVSSQGLKLDRTAGIVFDIGVFTNLEPDHIGPNAVSYTHLDGTDFRTGKRTFRERISYGSESI